VAGSAGISLPLPPSLFCLDLCFVGVAGVAWLQNIDSRDLAWKIFGMNRLQGAKSKADLFEDDNKKGKGDSEEQKRKPRNRAAFV
jgi:hypothetical protein